MQNRLMFRLFLRATLHGYDCPGKDGRLPGRTCTTPFAHYELHCMDTPMPEGIGSST